MSRPWDLSGRIRRARAYPTASAVLRVIRAATLCVAVVGLLDQGRRPCGFAAEATGLPDHRSLFTTSSRFGTLEVTEAAGVRYLFVDGVLQTAMYADPGKVAKECHLFSRRYWLELLPYYHPEGKRCLLVGLGGGLLPAVLAGYGVRTRGVEIDPKVLQAARTYFGYRQEASISDGRDYLERSAEQHDFIVIDAFAGATFPYRLASKECFELVQRRLADRGILALNLISKPAGSPVSASVAETLRSVFPHVLVYRTDSPERVQSLICFASERPLRLTLHPHGRRLGVTAGQLEDLAQFEVKPNWPQQVVLTDGHNPLDRQWSCEADQWRQGMVRLFGREPPEKREEDDAHLAPIPPDDRPGSAVDRVPAPGRRQ